MKILKQIFAVMFCVLTLLVLAVTLTFLFIDNATLMAQIAKKIESATGTRISYGKDAIVTRTLSPTITIKDLNIEDTNTHLKIHTNLLQLQVSLPELLMGRLEIPLLVLGDTRVEINESDSTKKLNLPQSFPFRPILHDIRISQISIVRSNGKISLPAVDIKQLTVTVEPNTDKLICVLLTPYGGKMIDVVATLPRIQVILEQERLPFSLAIKDPSFHLSLEGFMDLRASSPTLEADINIEAADLTRISSFAKKFSVFGELAGKARISGTFDQLSIREYDLNIKTADGFNLNVAGQFDLSQIDAGFQPENLDLKLRFNTPNTHLAQTFLFDKIPKSGTIQGRAEIHSNKGAPSLENIVVEIHNAKDIQVDLTGRIKNLFALTGFDLSINGELESPDFLATILPKNLDPLKHISFSTGILGSYPQFNIRKCNLNIKTVNALDLNVSGQLDLTNDYAGLPIENMDFKLKFTAPNTHSARSLFFEAVPEFGAVQGKAQIHSTKGAPSLEKIIVQTRDAKGIQVDLKGRIDSFPFDPDIANTGYDLDVKMISVKTAVMGERLGMEIPLSGPLDIAYRIEGDTQALRLEKVDLSAGEKNGIQIKTGGRVAFGKWDQPDPIERIDLAVRMKSQDTRALGEALGKQVPELGRVTAQARLHTVSGNHRIDDVQVRIKDTMPLKLSVTGSAAQVIFFPKPAVKGIGLVATASGETSSLLTDMFFLPLATPTVGGFKASAKITGNSVTLGLRDLSFVANLNDKEKQKLSLIVTGQLYDVNNLDTLSLKARVTAQDLKKIGSLLGQEWPKIGPVELDSSIFKKDEGIELDTRMTVGEAQIDGITRIVSRRGTPFISGKIRAQNLFVPSMIEKKNKSGKDGQTDALFSFSREPLTVGWLKKVDMDLLIDIASFDKERMNLESAQFRIDLESGSLDVKSARFVYPKGEINLDVLLELEKDLKISVNASGENINPWQTLSMRQPDIKDDFNAELDIDIDITSSGGSEHELAANMGGSIFLILKNGKMRREPLDMLFTDLIGWTIGKTIGGKYIDIDCGVADYRITRGLITTNAFIIDSKDITIAGEGTIDLAQEQIDYVFLPKKKSKLIQRAEPVKVSGPLNNPSVKVMPWKSAAVTYGSLFFGPYVFAGVMAADFLMGAVRKEITTSPCSAYEKKHDQDQKSGSKESTPYGETRSNTNR